MNITDYILGAGYYFSLLLPIIGGIFVVKKMPIPIKLFFALTIAAFLAETIALAMAFGKTNNYSVYQTYFLIESTFFASIFYKWYERSFAKRAVLAGYSIVLVVWIYFNVIAYSEKGFSNIPLIVEGIVFIFMASVFMNKKITGARAPVLKDPRFWIDLGIMLNFSGNILIYAGLNYILTQGMALWRVHWVINILTNAIYLMGFICLKRIDNTEDILPGNGWQAAWDTAD